MNHVFLQDSQDPVVASLALLFFAGTGKHAVVKLDIPPGQMARVSGVVLHASDYGFKPAASDNTLPIPS
jgi:hypothetical protein